jgi:hypothetical protein
MYRTCKLLRHIHREIQKGIVLLAGGATAQTRHLRLERPAKDARHHGLRLNKATARLQQILRAPVQGPETARQEQQQLRVQPIQHIAQEFVRVLLLIAAKARHHLPDGLEAGLAIKNPPKKKQKKKTMNMVLGVFLNFKFFTKIIQTFLFETDFL